MSTYSDKRLKNAMRAFQSKAFEGGTSYIGSKLPFDEQVNSALLGVVDVFFPDDLQIRFYHRDTLVNDGRPSKFGYAYLVVDTPLKTEEMQNWMNNIPGTSTIDKKTGKQCIVPDNDYICSIEAIKGDPDIDTVAFICLGFLLMRGEEFEGREVEPYVTGSDVDEKITDADIPGTADNRISALVPEMINTATAGFMDQTEVDSRIDSLAPGIADTEIQNDVPGMIADAIVGKIEVDEFVVGPNTGRITLSNGFMVEWGYYTFTDSFVAGTLQSTAITFTNEFAYIPSITLNYFTNLTGYMNISRTGASGTGFTLNIRVGVNSENDITVYWMAIGKRRGY